WPTANWAKAWCWASRYAIEAASSASTSSSSAGIAFTNSCRSATATSHSARWCASPCATRSITTCACNCAPTTFASCASARTIPAASAGPAGSGANAPMAWSRWERPALNKDSEMINVDLQQLVQALDAETRRDLENAAERCVVRGGSKVLVEDLLLGLLERSDGLLVRALQDAAVDAGGLAQALQPQGENSESRNPVFSSELVQWLPDDLLATSHELGQSHVDQAALILALLRNPLRYAGSHYQPLLAKLNAERLREFALAQQPQQAGQPAAPGDTNLQRFTHNFTQQARDGKLDPVLCRDAAIRQMIDILARRRKNNPIVVGEAGVGKTAIVEGLALRIAHGEVPDALKGVELLCLDLGLLQAGASVKGEFERRLQGVIDEVKNSPKPIILFIDEAHTLIGAGGQAGSGDAANLLKPA